MSQIEDLIAKHCPNGVEFIELQKLFTTRNGYTPSRRKAEYWENGTIPWFRLADIRGGDRILTEAIENVSPSAVKKSGLFPAGTIIISTLATIGEHALLEVSGLCNQQLTALTLREEYAGLFNIKFLFYYTFVLGNWCKKNTMNSSFPSVDMKQFKRFKFPVLPLEAQNEIVRILDSFTQLEADLEAELEARRKQYEYYRDSLLSLENLTNRLGSAVRLVSLKDIASYSAEKIPSSLTDNSSYVGVDNLIANKRGKKISDYAPNTAKLSRFQPGDILIGNIRPYLRKIWHSDLDGGASGDVLVITIKSEKRKEIISKFLYHVLASENFFEYNNRFARGAKMPRGDKNAVMDYKVPIPPLPEQERIVAILDKFDALVNDLSSGLPAEIAARRKQYEYYRDRLLTFTPAK